MTTQGARKGALRCGRFIGTSRCVGKANNFLTKFQPDLCAG